MFAAGVFLIVPHTLSEREEDENILRILVCGAPRAHVRIHGRRAGGAKRSR